MGPIAEALKNIKLIMEMPRWSQDSPEYAANVALPSKYRAMRPPEGHESAAGQKLVRNIILKAITNFNQKIFDPQQPDKPAADLIKMTSKERKLFNSIITGISFTKDEALVAADIFERAADWVSKYGAPGDRVFVPNQMFRPTAEKIRAYVEMYPHVKPKRPLPGVRYRT